MSVITVALMVALTTVLDGRIRQRLDRCTQCHRHGGFDRRHVGAGRDRHGGCSQYGLVPWRAPRSPLQSARASCRPRL